ncbi:glycerophosphodiester phosphodiesterase [Parapedobacter sp. 10938]|uniref:glycerophosphodiester phosphodiesterase n=1 Tax=Parapedobacter flavus TaxID=3110225 RepID=UPI002DBE0D0F|nr:glycerophosphodiester phosphodiesterase [Parapedobacter sp. 10938]MEC3878118.1 glycerophosphodiester phosphodiesterase [Parapedobacter sp. 10938]
MNVKFRIVGLFAAILLLGNTVYAQQAEVKLFAHRGGAHEYDENTISAFQATYDKGLRGYELDVRRTADDQLVIFHDANLKRIVGQEGAIEDLTLDEIKKLRTKKGNEIPTLDEVLAFFSDKPWVYIEFEMKTNKPMYDEKTLEAYCDQLYQKAYAAMPPTSNYVLTSFDTRPLRYLKTTYPTVDLLLIKGAPLSQEVLDEAKELGIDRVGCNVDGTTRAMVKEAKKQGFKVSLWPGRSVADFLLGVSLGSDYLCSDVPVAVTEWVKANAPWITLK